MLCFRLLYAIVLSSDVYDVCVCVCECECVCVCVCVCFVHWHCSAQLSMFNMEKCYRNKTIIIIIITWHDENRKRKQCTVTALQMDVVTAFHLCTMPSLFLPVISTC